VKRTLDTLCLWKRPGKQEKRWLSLSNLKVNESIYTNNSYILNEVKFYSELYKSDNLNEELINDYIRNTKLENVLNEHGANLCEGHLTEQECFKALTTINLNKSPGSDGLSVEFYQTFWPSISKFAREVFNDGFLKRELCHTQKIGVISLLNKKGDPTNIENWRPITLS